MKLLFTLSEILKEWEGSNVLNCQIRRFFTLTKNFRMEMFSTVNVYKNKLDLDGLKRELKLDYAADVTEQASNIQEVAEIIWELETNQALADLTRLLR